MNFSIREGLTEEVEIMKKEIDYAVLSEDLKKQTAFARKTYFRRSKLDKIGHDLLKLYELGNSIAELHRYATSKNIDVKRSTVSRFVKKHNE